MSARPVSSTSIALAALLGGCSFIDQVRFTTAEYAGRAVVFECALSLNHRAANLSAINGWLATNSHTPRAMPLDCDGDALSDF